MKTISRLASFFAVATLLTSLQAFAGVPATLNYQGTLTDNTGQPVNGSKSITFRLYNAPTGGTAFWTETQTINLVNGRLSVVLGGNAGNPIDPKKFTGETYIGIQVAPDTEMPRQKFTSVAYAFQAGEGGVPSGGIIMWSGPANAIPAGWALCDGNNGTPDLRDKFILGAGGNIPGPSGGAATINLRHSHTTANHSLTVDQLPQHSHGVSDPGHQHSVSFKAYDGDGQPHATDGWDIGDTDANWHTNTTSSSKNSSGIAIQNTGGGQPHNHGSTGENLNSAQSILPPYFVLAFIMKL